MSMHKYANAGPVMQAMMVEIDPPIEPMQPQMATMDDLRHGQAFVTEAFRQMANIADQMSTLAVQIAEVRQRLERLERPPFVGPSIHEMLAQQQRLLQQQSAFQTYVTRTTWRPEQSQQLFGSKLG